MGFSLTIQEGTEVGKQFTFEQQEVSIGRTAENDVVLFDPGVSRKHAVIRADGSRFFIQDQGSANGTQVNGSTITEEELQPGDAVSIGPVVLAFDLAQDPGSTMRLDEAPKKKLVKADPRANGETKRPTVVRPALPSSTPASGPKRPVTLATGPSKKKALAELPSQKPSMSASERARFLRENAGPLGKLKLMLMEKPPAVRYSVFGGAGLLGLVLLIFLVRAIMPKEGTGNLGGGDKSKEPFKIGEKKKKDVYGLGDHLGVTVQTKDELHFEFDYIESAIPQAYWIRFESKGVERNDEVEITLNGVSIGYVQGGMGDYTKEQRVRLPKKHLRPGITNEIVLDNVLNPPGNEGWAISAAKLEIKALPVCARDECLARASDKYKFATQRLENKGISAENLYEGWGALRDSLLYMESLDPKPDLYGLVQQTLRDTDRELEFTCNKIMLAAKQAEEMGDLKKALAEYKNGLKWFPTDEHHCRARLVEKIYEYGGDPNDQPEIGAAPSP